MTLFAAMQSDAIGTSRTCHDARLKSAKWAKADIDQGRFINRDFMGTRLSRFGLMAQLQTLIGLRSL